MRREVLAYLACPTCGSELEGTFEDAEGDEVLSGRLSCAGCRAEYPITRGVPRMNRSMQDLERVAKTFSYQWKAHHRGELEDETVFGLTAEEDWRKFLEATCIGEEQVAGIVALDAGCGSGRLTRQIGEHRAAVVIGVDINEAVDEAFEACRALPNVHIVQGNIFALPLAKQAFDLVWSNGVIHHTPDAEGAHAALARHVSPGGILYVWVYAKRFNPFRLVRDLLHGLRITRLPEGVLMVVAKLFSYISLPLLWLYRGIRKLPGLRPRTAWGRYTVRRRTLRELYLTWFDAISPEYVSRHTEPEVIGWFERAGFREIRALPEPKVGVRGVAPG